jgi:hydroxymethylpyrimidine/phosphomethylpyrimidine kinase
LKPPVALTIAGSDSGGGAGIQADLKTFAAMGVHGTSAITAITAQNTVTVTAIEELPLEIIRAQIDAVYSDLHPAAVKTGMLSSPEIIDTVASYHLDNLVVDPVMVAKGGARLLREEAVEALRRLLIPEATVITPNLPEAEVLLGRRIGDLDDRRRAAQELLDLGPTAVVLKGGHAGDALDLFYDGDMLVELRGQQVKTANTHGSGCVFSAAIAAGIARRLPLQEAVRQAKDFIQNAIAHSLELGEGHGPVNPNWALG